VVKVTDTRNPPPLRMYLYSFFLFCFFFFGFDGYTALPHVVLTHLSSLPQSLHRNNHPLIPASPIVPFFMICCLSFCCCCPPPTLPPPVQPFPFYGHTPHPPPHACGLHPPSTPSINETSPFSLVYGDRTLPLFCGGWETKPRTMNFPFPLSTPLGAITLRSGYFFLHVVPLTPSFFWKLRYNFPLHPSVHAEKSNRSLLSLVTFSRFQCQVPQPPIRPLPTGKTRLRRRSPFSLQILRTPVTFSQVRKQTTSTVQPTKPPSAFCPLLRQPSYVKRRKSHCPLDPPRNLPGPFANVACRTGTNPL